MAKLQQIKRANGSVVSSVNIPLEIIEFLQWEKGISLDLKCEGKEVVIRRIWK